MKTLLTSNTNETILVDDKDFERLSKYTWSVNTKGRVRRMEHKHIDIFSSFRKTINIPISNDVMQNFNVMYDHINRNKLDNRKENLRPSTETLNQFNKEKTKTKTSSKYKGVCFHTKMKQWTSNISFKNKRIWLGSFNAEEEAARAYDRKAKELAGEFAILNFP